MVAMLAAVMTLSAAGVMVTPTMVSAAPNMMSICHVAQDTGEFKLISVSGNGNAVNAHIAHGDGVPAGPVPAMAGYAFDDSCTPGVDSETDSIVDSVDNCPTVANTDQLDQYGSEAGDACEDSDGNGTADVDETTSASQSTAPQSSGTAPPNVPTIAPGHPGGSPS